MNIAFFDFDGTITTKDSLPCFIRYAVTTPNYLIGLLKLSPILIAYTLKLIPNYIAKEKLIVYFFKDWNTHDFQQLAKQFSLEEIDKITRPKAIKQIKWHQQQGHKVVVVSASIEYWLKPWCDKNHIDLISTRLEIRNDKITGKFATQNCYGSEKASRIKEQYNLTEYNIIYAYGDSRGDTEMLELANKPFYQYFN